MRRRSVLGAVFLAMLSSSATAQDRGAIALGEAILGLGVNTRVLLVGAHPDDEDTPLIAWLSRGRHVKTAYLSLTRGDGGQNLIGNELGEALGAIRTEELLAARRVDGASQYFTRAFDFGFSKNVEDTYRHWPRDSILGDVVKVVRAFRPHVIVGVFSGTPRDGHGHHQVSGMLAREAYDHSSDTVRFPVRSHGRPWTALKFYRSSRGNPTSATLRYDAGEYSPLLGRSYAEIAGESRSQHRSQGFGAIQRKGPVLGYLRREASRVNEAAPAASETSIFDGIDTTWTRVRSKAPNTATRQLLDSMPGRLAEIRAAYNAFAPRPTLVALDRLSSLLNRVVMFTSCPPDASTASCRLPAPERPPWPGHLDPEFESSLAEVGVRIRRALQLASAVAVEPLAQREIYAVGERARVVSSVYNRGHDSVRVSQAIVIGRAQDLVSGHLTRTIGPNGVLRDTLLAPIDSIAQPWWLVRGRRGAMFVSTGIDREEESHVPPPFVYYDMDVGGSGLTFGDASAALEPLVFRTADPVKGEMRRQVGGTPAITLTIDHQIEYARAKTPFDRDIEVRLRYAGETPRDVRVSLTLPTGLRADTAVRTVRVERHDEQRTVNFRVRGQLGVGEHQISARAESNGETFTTGYQLIDYDHIRRQRLYRSASTTLSVVDINVPSTLRVGYVPGVGDNVAASLAGLGIPVTVIPAGDVARANLGTFSAIVVGPRAYDAYPELAAANARLVDFARKGGTLVVQYGQYEMTEPGILPYPITLSRPADRITNEDAPMKILDPNARELRTPNRITEGDFAGWVQERGLYMPRTFDQRYRAVLETSDPGEPPNRGAILVVPLGAGSFVYTTLSFFRQLPAGNPGAARLFVNLLSAGLTSRAAQ